MFGAFGLEIRKARPEMVARASMRGALRQLSSLGFAPRTVIDVGVAYQTSELYEEFAGANFLLIEPLAEFEPFLRKICADYKAQYVLAAAGEVRGRAVLNIHGDKTGSSLFKEADGASVDGTPRQVPVITIDEVCGENKLAGPYLIKVDVPTAELQVLAGARRTLEETDAVILEVSLFRFLIDGPQFHDLVSRMKQLGFVAYDVCGFLYGPLDHALAQIDIGVRAGAETFPGVACVCHAGAAAGASR